MVTRSRGIALTALLSAVYVAYALLGSFIFGSITHGADNFVVRSLVFVILVGLNSGFGFSTIMGGISGLVLEISIPTPVRFYLFPSLLAYGFVLDIVINIKKAPNADLGTIRMLLGTILASLAMSITALTVFTLVGFFPPALIPLIWTFEIVIDIVLGIIGATIGLVLLRQLVYLKSS